MFRLPSPRTAIALAGLGFSLGSAPALAAESHGSRTAPVATAAPAPQVAMLPGLPPAARRYEITPERQALLNTIRYAEGTWKDGHPIGYQVMFGGGIFQSLDRHPDRVVYSSRYASAAAGAYQFMPFTWAMIRQHLPLSDFRPEAQDQGALFLIERRGALHLADSGQFTPQLAAKLAPEWASFPTLRGSSYYGQPVKRFADLRRFYQENLALLRQNQSEPALEPVAIQPVPPACTDDSLACRLDNIGPRRVAAPAPVVSPVPTPQS
ncbi:MAG: endolysin [Cyanobium sp.]